MIKRFVVFLIDFCLLVLLFIYFYFCFRFLFFSNFFLQSRMVFVTKIKMKNIKAYSNVMNCIFVNYANKIFNSPRTAATKIGVVTQAGTK